MDDKHAQKDPLYRLDGEPWLDEDSETVEMKELGDKFIPLENTIGKQWEPSTPPEWEKRSIRRRQKTLKDLEPVLKMLGTEDELHIWKLYKAFQMPGQKLTYEDIAKITGHSKLEVKRIVDRVTKRFERRKKDFI